MELETIIGSLQVVLTAIQIKLDHFKKQKPGPEMQAFQQWGEAVRDLESALAETLSFTAQTEERLPNDRLASLWHEASTSLRRVNVRTQLVDIAFEKNLYWRNPQVFNEIGDQQLFSISIENVVSQLRKLRKEYEKIQRRSITYN